MQCIFACEEFPKKVCKTIFLAGPTPRNMTTQSWRPKVLEILKANNYDGSVFIPEPRNGLFTEDYTEQINWELEGLKRADIIIFWIPRSIAELPGFTTNVEFGYWIQTGKCILGYPSSAEKMRYLDQLATKHDVPIHKDLKGIVNHAIDQLGQGSIRFEGECNIPLHVWNTISFQNWWQSQKNVGNKLIDANIRFVNFVKKNVLFAWIADVSIYNASEERIKSNEFVFSRSDLFSCLLYFPESDLMNTKIVLVKEFRSSSQSKDSYTWELVGGSSISKSDPVQIISSEVEEEIGLKLNLDRLKYVDSRQMAGTFAAHKNHLYSYQLTHEELDIIESSINEVFGVIEDSELTYIVIKSFHDILNDNLMDWSNIGMISKGLSI
ncbi:MULTISPECIES: nucleoside 2-deoxyribosyltransferase domain-containing protein [Paenibacillus]|uniref:nucleoside 2-deoxyribosyltransferase domain-containing protein n=1 Tax=Paenibacillus TaxID=44249 RepID=UPI00042A4B92|nr:MULTISPECIES: nucleoside 2-deoxyribosyltransferase domain-containing protein [Paenibacillus]OZQ61316.1 hypothetical protein CA599_28430 [Paenibacillus taichungensis]